MYKKCFEILIIFFLVFWSNVALAKTTIGVSSAFDDLTDYRYTSTLSQTTTSAFIEELVKWDRFDVVERINARQVLKEQRLSQSGCSITGLDYVVIGSITDVYTDTVGGIFHTRTAAYSTVNITVIEVTTGKIIYADSEMSEVIRSFNYKKQPSVKSRYIADASRLSARMLAIRTAAAPTIK